MAAETALDLTFERGDTFAFDAIELGKPDQIRVYKTCPQYPGVNVARILQRPGDVWNNLYVRCLCAKYDTNERDGQTYRRILSFSLPGDFGQFGNNLLWELHHRSNLYNLTSLGVAPLAINTKNGNFVARVGAGLGVVGRGYSVWKMDQFLGPIVYDRRVDIGMDINFSETNGHFYVWLNSTGTPDEAMFSKPPTWKHDGPTLPFSNTGQHVGSDGLYVETGIYSGSASVSEIDVVDFFGEKRRPASFDMGPVIKSIGTPGVVTPPPPPPATGTVRCSIQANDSVEAKVVDVTTEVTGAVRAIQYYLDGNKYALSLVWPNFPIQVQFTGLSGAHTFGVEGLDINAQPVQGTVFKTYPIRVVAPAEPPKKLNTKVDRIRMTAWLNWTSIQGATGYKLFLDGVNVSSAGPIATSARFEFGPGDHQLEVETIPAGLAPRESRTVKQIVT